jgi:hypothetical protein
VTGVSPLRAPLVSPSPYPSSANFPSTPAFALLWTFALFRWLWRRLEGGLAWLPTRFASERTAKRIALEHPALCAETPCSVNFLSPATPLKEEYRSGHYRQVRLTSRTCPSCAPLSQLVPVSAEVLSHARPPRFTSSVPESATSLPSCLSSLGMFSSVYLSFLALRHPQTSTLPEPPSICPRFPLSHVVTVNEIGHVTSLDLRKCRRLVIPATHESLHFATGNGIRRIQ